MIKLAMILLAVTGLAALHVSAWRYAMACMSAHFARERASYDALRVLRTQMHLARMDEKNELRR